MPKTYIPNLHSPENSLKVLTMSDYYDDDVQQQHILRDPVQPQKYNIVLTRDGQEIDFDFSPAAADMITRFGYIRPNDPRCIEKTVSDEEGMFGCLSPVIGKTFHGQLAYHTQKQAIISLHETAILGYQRQKLIDPRIGNEVATFWEIYLDQRIFPQSLDEEWQDIMARIIVSELEDADADRKLAEDIKDKLLQQAAEEFE